MMRLFWIFIVSFGVASAQEPAAQPTSQPLSLPSASLASQCEGCFTLGALDATLSAPLSMSAEEPRGMEIEEPTQEHLAPPLYRASARLLLGGSAGLLLSGGVAAAGNDFPVGAMGLGMVSALGINATIGTLGLARFYKTKKLRPLILSSLASGAFSLTQMVFAVGISFDNSDPTGGEQFASATLAGGALAALPVIAGLVLKTSQEVSKSISARDAEAPEETWRIPPLIGPEKHLAPKVSSISMKAWAGLTVASALMFPLLSADDPDLNPKAITYGALSGGAMTASSLALLSYGFDRRRKKPAELYAVTGITAAQAALRAGMLYFFDARDSRADDGLGPSGNEVSFFVSAYGCGVSSAVGGLLLSKALLESAEAYARKKSRKR